MLVNATSEASWPQVDGTSEALFDVSAGERTVPGIWHENYWFRRHEVVYEWVADLVRRRRGATREPVVVVDAGCGEGYGTTTLAAEATTLALDYDAWTAQHLARAHPQLPAVRGNLAALPLRADGVDVVVSLQTIEHLWDQSGFVAETARVLRPGGTAVISTPNRRTFPPGNVFHHRELDEDELASLVRESFGDVAVYGVEHGDRLRAWEREHGGLVDAQIRTPVDAWPGDVRTMVASVAVDDFEIAPATPDCLDLVAVGTAP